MSDDLKRARDAHKAHAWATARELYERVLSGTPGDDTVHRDLASCCLNLQDFAAAGKNDELAIAINPANRGAWVGLVIFRAYQSDDASARTAFLEVRERGTCGPDDGNFAEAAFYFGRWKLELGEFAQAQEHLKTVLNADATTPYFNGLKRHAAGLIERARRLQSELPQVGLAPDSERGFMLEAIEQAAHCVAEGHRKDTPKVGVVLARHQRVVVATHRGARDRPGDHAEYIALTSDEVARVDFHETTAYTTLEPCTYRGGKNKVPCAKRLIEANIGRVVIGMKDPNPNISGDGISILRRAGVEVELFPSDLQAQVQRLNHEFILQHRARHFMAGSESPSESL